MPATVPGIKLQGQEYESVNALFSITKGTAITIQNQGETPYKVTLADSKPDVKTDAFRIAPPDPDQLVTIDSGDPEVWVFGHVVIQAQE